MSAMQDITAKLRSSKTRFSRQANCGEEQPEVRAIVEHAFKSRRVTQCYVVYSCAFPHAVLELTKFKAIKRRRMGHK
jgi:hypothetical protein